MPGEAREDDAEVWLTPRRPFQLNDISSAGRDDVRTSNQHRPRDGWGCLGARIGCWSCGTGTSLWEHCALVCQCVEGGAGSTDSNQGSLIWRAPRKKSRGSGQTKAIKRRERVGRKESRRECHAGGQKADANAVLKVSDRGEAERDEVRCEEGGEESAGTANAREAQRHTERGRTKDRRPSLRVGLNADVGTTQYSLEELATAVCRN